MGEAQAAAAAPEGQAVNAVHQALYTLLTDNSGAGEALADLGSRIYRDGDDFTDSARDRLAYPLAVLHVGSAVPRDVTRRGEGWQVYDGESRIEIVSVLPGQATTQRWETAREAAESVGAGLEELLDANRYLATDAHPTGCWHDLAFGEVTGGRGQFDVHECWAKVYPVTFTFRRWRA
jgi:hypothetical protein